MTKGFGGDAVAAATSEKTPQAVVVKDFKPSEVLSTHRPRLAAVEQNCRHQGLKNATLGLERSLASEPRTDFRRAKALRARPILPLISS